MSRDISEFLSEFDFNTPTRSSTHTFNKEQQLELFKKESTTCVKLPINLPEMVFTDHKPEGAWENIYLIASKWFKKPLSEYSFSASDFDYSLLEFLKTNGLCVSISCFQSSTDSAYIFFYKDVFVYVSCSFSESSEKLILNGLSVFTTVETPAPHEDFEKFRTAKKEEKPKIGIIKSGRGGMYVSKLSLNNTQTFSLDHYNEDFEEFEKNITEELSLKKPGLFLLHGDPGTGKSSAIRHLISKVKRNFIFIPPQMISHLSTPEFADIITDTQKGSVLILEDAEKALIKRESEDGFSNSTLVSSILNLTDGLYADLGQLAIVATYNCSRSLIDPALLRKGRLKAEYKFDKLKRKRAQNLADKLDLKINIEEDMTLADIFNHDGQYSNKERTEKKAIGFGFGG